ncbi:MAG: CCA tRNA nucleotidyltransferase [Hyphomicrobium sp.]
MGGSKPGGNGHQPPRLAGVDWLVREETQAVFAALAAGGFEARAVGGAVRNTLMGRPVKDVDLATPARPEDVIRLAEAAGLRAIATGLQHGTVTVVARHTPFEVTTLRRDVETFGRHATVAFTDDWAADARRRDFTINALYCTSDGTLHDPLGGIDDVALRRVRFIGDAADRIREDFLRILRFFRFTAEYSDGRPDPDGLDATVAQADGLQQLSGERIRAELLRLLVTPAVIPMLRVMEKGGILARILPAVADVAVCSRLCAIEAALGRPPDPVLRLGALAAARPGAALGLRGALRLSAHEYERLARMALPDRAFDPATPELWAKSYLYREGPDVFMDGVLSDWARSTAPAADPLRRERALLPSRWTAPVCPVRGADILALGIPPGPFVGRILSDFEEWWIAAGFPRDAEMITAELRRLAAVTKP